MTAGTEPLLSVRDLKTYFYPDEGIVRAVDGVTFDIFPGKTLGVVGESGCGKSVTARSILGIVEHPGRTIAGEIILRHPEGRDDADLEAALGRARELDLVRLDSESRQMRMIRGGVISLIFQEPMTSFSPVHTVGNQIIEVIRYHRRVSKREARDRAIELLRQVGIPRAEARLDEYSFQLSGGLRQRAMIAMALSCDPLLLVADEPTTALDVTTQAQILDLLRELQEQNGMAIMLITHNLGVVAEMADEVAVMYLGKVVEYGAVDDIFHNAKHPYTRALLESIPSIRAEPRVRLPTISGSIPHPYNRPSGCPFHPRCSRTIAGTCERAEPVLTKVGTDHLASCFLYPGSEVPLPAESRT
ncbi:MAG: ABC transporter ATP-binding protein [Chloroflexota bacterium]|nr:MAG: ABC transporter ATP-binding protein [Chloroflexota bacterium]